MRVLIIGLVVLALGVAGISTYLIQSFFGEANIEKLESQVRPKVTKVLIATKEIRTGDPLLPNNIQWQAWTGGDVSGSFVTVTEPTGETTESDKAIKDYIDAIARREFAAGEPIVIGKVFKAKDGIFMAGMLGAGMRAIAITTKPNNSVGGFLLPGDYVDVLLTHVLAGKMQQEKTRSSARSNTNDSASESAILPVYTYSTETILNHVRVLAIDQQFDTVAEKSLVGKTATLEVTPKQAEILTTAVAMGNITLSLRSLGDLAQQVGSTSDIEISSLLTSISGGKKKKKTEAKTETTNVVPTTKPVVAVTPTKKPQKKSSVIKVYLGGEGKTQEIRINE
ncbi:MAG: Flp pilus assembly protein CpaB [Rhodospirillaceae bacterium]|nr:Flp pilus assembly protein CpaB [Rhodospirillaceae bacterium]